MIIAASAATYENNSPVQTITQNTGVKLVYQVKKNNVVIANIYEDATVNSQNKRVYARCGVELVASGVSVKSYMMINGKRSGKTSEAVTAPLSGVKWSESVYCGESGKGKIQFGVEVSDLAQSNDPSVSPVQYITKNTGVQLVHQIKKNNVVVANIYKDATVNSQNKRVYARCGVELVASGYSVKSYMMINGNRSGKASEAVTAPLSGVKWSESVYCGQAGEGKIQFGVDISEVAKESVCYSGIDVSQWQGNINWSQVKGAGIQFALVRAGYGDTLSYPEQIDNQYEANYKGCKNNNIPVGVYFYSYAKTVQAAEREADSCLALLKGKQFEYPIFYDVEEMSTFNSGKTNDIIKAFCTKLEKAGYYPGIYIYRSALQSYVSKEVKDKYAVAVAEYGSKLNYNGPYGIWQNSGSWTCSGISVNVDHDYCYKNYPEIIKSRGLNGFKSNGSTAAFASKPAQNSQPQNTGKKSINEIAEEVIVGKWGAGADRVQRLTAAGYDAAAVQQRVNQLMK